MDALLAKIEGAPTGVKLLMVLAEAQDLLVTEGAAVVRARAGSKMELIAGVTAWRDGHEGTEWTQATAMVFGEVLKAFDAAVQAVAAEAAAVAAEAAAAAVAAAVADAAVVAAQLVGARVRVEELEKVNTELKEETNELKGENGRLAEQLRTVQRRTVEAQQEARRAIEAAEGRVVAAMAELEARP